MASSEPCKVSEVVVADDEEKQREESIHRVRTAIIENLADAGIAAVAYTPKEGEDADHDCTTWRHIVPVRGVESLAAVVRHVQRAEEASFSDDVALVNPRRKYVMVCVRCAHSAGSYRLLYNWVYEGVNAFF